MKFKTRVITEDGSQEVYSAVTTEIVHGDNTVMAIAEDTFGSTLAIDIFNEFDGTIQLYVDKPKCRILVNDKEV